LIVLNALTVNSTRVPAVCLQPNTEQLNLELNFPHGIGGINTCFFLLINPKAIEKEGAGKRRTQREAFGKQRDLTKT